MNKKFYLKAFLGVFFRKVSYYKISSLDKLDLSWLKKQKVKLLVFDVDDTLAADGFDISQETYDFLVLVSKRIPLCFLSNAVKKQVLLEKFCVEHKTRIFIKADKPHPRTYVKMCKFMSVSPEDSAIIGDRGIDVMTGFFANNKLRILIPVNKSFAQKSPFVVKVARFLEDTFFLPLGGRILKK